MSGSSKKCTFLPSPTLLETLYIFGIDAVQKTMKTQNGMRTNCLVHRRSVVFLALSTLLKTIYHFSLDAVQKTMRAEKYFNELPGSLRKDTFEQDQHSKRHFMFLYLMMSKRPRKLKRMRTNCLSHRRSVVFKHYQHSLKQFIF